MDQTRNDKKSIAVVGGGMMGIAVSLELARGGRFDITLFEKNAVLGGLSTSFAWEDVVWDKFYHVVLSTDTALLAFIDQLGLSSDLFWQETRSGFYSAGRLVSLSSISDFIRFPFLSPFDKLRLALGIMYSGRIRNATRLDRLFVRQWLTRLFGRRVYEKIWDPLLRSKLGEARERTSASFIHATIQRLYGARSGDGKKEQMGHVQGGYHRILGEAERRLRESGVKVLVNREVSSLVENSGKRSRIGSGTRPLRLAACSGELDFDTVILTVPCPEVLRIVHPDHDNAYWQSLQHVEYLGVICVLLVVSKKVSPYYVINLLDKDLPFTGVIEATNVIPPHNVGGKHLVYLPKYVTADDPLWARDDEWICDQFEQELLRMFDHLSAGDILHRRVFREKHVQPLQQVNTLDRSIGFETPVKNVFLVNTSMIYNSTLNNNAVVELAHRMAQFVN
jgi:protoporphyrinogen oxidase